MDAIVWLNVCFASAGDVQHEQMQSATDAAVIGGLLGVARVSCKGPCRMPSRQRGIDGWERTWLGCSTFVALVPAFGEAATAVGDDIVAHDEWGVGDDGRTRGSWAEPNLELEVNDAWACVWTARVLVKNRRFVQGMIRKQQVKGQGDARVSARSRRDGEK